MEELVCKTCGSLSYKLREKGIHIGAYCEDCGAWIKWVSQSSQVNKTIQTTGCRKCGSMLTVEKSTNVHKGLYCATCGAWLKWLKK